VKVKERRRWKDRRGREEERRGEGLIEGEEETGANRREDREQESKTERRENDGRKREYRALLHEVHFVLLNVSQWPLALLPRRVC
jgi:hypothetical protein